MRKNNSCGFTLTELLIVIAILGILAGVGTFAYTRYLEDAKVKATITGSRILSQAVIAYQASTSKWPQRLQEIGAYVKKQGDKDPFKDAWGNDFLYRAPRGQASGLITSFGPDGQRGGDDDIEEEIK